MKRIGEWIGAWKADRERAAIERRLEAAAAEGRALRDEVEEWAASGRERPALVGTTESLSFRELYERANRWSRFAIVQGIGSAEPVALFFSARPERTAAWLGLSAVAAVPTLVDPSLDAEDVARAIDALKPRRLVVEGALLPLFEAAARHMGHPCEVWVHGPHDMAYQRLDEMLDNLSAVRLVGRDRRRIDRDMPCLALVARDADDGRIRVFHVDHGRLAALLVELPALFGLGRDDTLATRETTASLESLIAPLAALSAGAACRLVGLDDGLDGVAATVLHRDVAPFGPVDLPVIVAGTPTPDEPAHPSLRRWRLLRDGETIALHLDGTAITLPGGAGAMRS